MSQSTAPMPDLRIIEIDRLRAHEVHDSQRSEPLTERLRMEPTIINPPVVAPLPGGDFVILDGANRAFALRAIGCPHVLVQVTAYREGGVELSIWRHVVADWEAATLLDRIGALPNVQIVPRREPSDEPEPSALATIATFAGERWTVIATGPDAATNAPLRSLVHVYQSQATLQRTALADTEEIWRYHPTAAALLTFRHYQPEDIMQAALSGDFLPPGVSRHIVHGRAVRVNYPMVDLRDPYTPLERKNEALRRWTQEKIAARRVRFTPNPPSSLTSEGTPMTPTVDEQLRGARWLLDPSRYIILRLNPEGAAAAAAIIAEHNQPFQALILDKDELSLVTSVDLADLATRRFAGVERGSVIYRLITLDVVFTLDVVGVLARLTPALADAGIPILAISSFSRDHFLVPEDHADAALGVLEALSAV